MSDNDRSLAKDLALVQVRNKATGFVLAKLGAPFLLVIGLIILVVVVLSQVTVGSGQSNCEVPSLTARDGDNNEIAYSFLVSDPELKLEPFQAAAIVGNGIHESGSDPIDTHVVNYIGAAGGWQWYQGRLNGLKNHARDMGLPWTDIRAQLSWMKYELTVTRRSNLEALRATTNIKDATEVFEATFEVSGVISSYPKRVAHAISVYERYADTTDTNVSISACSDPEIDGSLRDPGPGPQDPNNGNLVPRASNLRDYIFERWGCDKLKQSPCVREIGGYAQRPAGTPQDHTLGLALDVTISDKIGAYPNEAQLAMGWEMACFIAANADELGVQYQIWQQLIWNVERTSEGGPGECSGSKTGWRPYTYGFGVTAGHYDHNHITVQPGVGG